MILIQALKPKNCSSSLIWLAGLVADDFYNRFQEDIDIAKAGFHLLDLLCFAVVPAKCAQFRFSMASWYIRL